ncbi:MAG: glutamate 5-kinase [Nitrospirae bacterium]|nr:MAG: glutamate 5-kinase [Nitrospirota bacterium]
MRHRILKEARRVVVKVGSRLVASKGIGLQTDWIERLAAQLAALKGNGREIVMVSSGAIVCGIEKLGLREYPKSLPMKQAAAAVGQSRLMWAYEKAFEKEALKVAQILLTLEDLTNRSRFLNSRHTLTALLDFGVVPIINENDTVAVEEIRFGDNDSLAGMVAHLVDADLLVILSDVAGLYTDDPRVNPKATLISLIPEVTADVQRLAGGTAMAAKKAASYGVATVILGGERIEQLSALFEGEDVGTLFLPQEQQLTSRKHWIAHTLKAKGQLVLDDGAVEALMRRGKSLLPSGITAVRGDFEAGDSVACVDHASREIAKGLVNYSSQAIAKIMGRKSADIQKTLGYKDYDEVIHRDNLVIE